MFCFCADVERIALIDWLMTLPSNTAEEERLIKAQQQLVSKWYVRNPGDVQQGVQHASAMATSEETDDDDDDAGAGGSGSDGDGDYYIDGDSDGEQEFRCEVCGMIGDDYDVMVAHENGCSA